MTDDTFNKIVIVVTSLMLVLTLLLLIVVVLVEKYEYCNCIKRCETCGKVVKK